MTAATATTIAPTRPPKLNFGGVLASEWIKFWSLRSSFWCCVILVVLVLGLSTAVAFGNGTDQDGIAFGVQQARAAAAATNLSTRIAELIVAVLGVLVISGEYGTGMIRSTLTAVPKRTPALLGKALVLAIVSFILGLIATYGSALLQAPLLSGSGIHTDFTDLGLNLSLLGGALYVTLIALMSFGIGALLRNSAGGIATALGFILVLPTVLQIVAAISGALWVVNLTAFLPTVAGAQLFAYPRDHAQFAGSVIQLTGTEGGLVLLAWAALMVLVAGVLLKRRDV